MSYTIKYTKTELIEMVADREADAQKLLDATHALNYGDDEMAEMLVTRALKKIVMAFIYLERLHKGTDRYKEYIEECYKLEDLLEAEYNFDNSIKVWELHGALRGNIQNGYF